ncbi:MAG: RNA polymerase subunit sigma [Proteobacteria bacterium HN_bin10]|nr:MAG: RNA polymerase subunit sigma [Proteobacteria bacterium HN_bin10]
MNGRDPLAPHRGKLLGLAYRMLGSRADAEDVLQDAYLRFASAQGVRNEEAFLVTTVTRLCLDRLKSARATREVYVSPWLPEPIVDAEALSPQAEAELADNLSFAFLLALDRLSPGERATFLLHDVFDKPFREIAQVLGKNEAACRQLASRARKAVRDTLPASPAPADEHAALLAAFMAAVSNGDLAQLTALLRADAIAFGDGGGVKLAALNVIQGADKVARFLVGLARKFAGAHFSFEPRAINGAPGYLVYRDGELDQALSIATNEGKIAAIYLVRNPQKLRHLH